jgi:hypothetical protein
MRNDHEETDSKSNWYELGFEDDLAMYMLQAKWAFHGDWTWLIIGVPLSIDKCMDGLFALCLDWLLGENWLLVVFFLFRVDIHLL